MAVRRAWKLCAQIDFFFNYMYILLATHTRDRYDKKKMLSKHSAEKKNKYSECCLFAVRISVDERKARWCHQFCIMEQQEIFTKKI